MFACNVHDPTVLLLFTRLLDIGPWTLECYLLSEIRYNHVGGTVLSLCYVLHVFRERLVFTCYYC